MIPVELVGGALDGHVDEVTLNNPDADVYLFECDRMTYAYAWCGTSTGPNGERWVLQYLAMVGRRAAPCS